jgi:hypothetical protein
MTQSYKSSRAGRSMLCACMTAALLLAAGSAGARDRDRNRDGNGGMATKSETGIHDRRDRELGLSSGRKAQGPVIRPAPKPAPGYQRPPGYFHRWRPTAPVKVITTPRPVRIPGGPTITPLPPTGKPIVRPVPERTGPVTVINRHNRRQNRP